MTTPNSNKLYSSINSLYDVMLWLTGYKFAVHYFINMLPFHEDEQLKVLDAGCGTGLYTFALLKHFPNAIVTAFDLNAEMVASMKSAVTSKGLDDTVIQIFCGDVTKPLPLPRQNFDLIITGGVLEYVDVSAAVRNLSPYLKTEGYFLNSPIKDSLVGRLVGWLFKFKPHTEETNIQSFTNNGFVLKDKKSLPVIKEAHLFQKVSQTISVLPR